MLHVLFQINKPYLPLASGKISFRNCVFIDATSAIMGLGINLMIGSTALIWNFVLCATLWTCYSANLPFLRWKQNPVLASLVMFACSTLVNPITYFLHIQTFVLKRPLVFTRSLIVTLLFMSFYSTGLALAKDIPDVEGDTKYGVDTFAARLGQKNVFWICVFLLEMAFGVAFLAGASSSSPFWIKFVTCLGNAVLGSILWYRTKYVDVTNPASTRAFYSFIWKLMMGSNHSEIGFRHRLFSATEAECSAPFTCHPTTLPVLPIIFHVDLVMLLGIDFAETRGVYCGFRHRCIAVGATSSSPPCATASSSRCQDVLALFSLPQSSFALAPLDCIAGLHVVLVLRLLLKLSWFLV
ncbi:glycinol 4-dimethylallyltransferase-like, partial [Vigna umbellata]|uniref:glycinol 4-dimethylallyltransferase-like n=1 Tax=Vigna umbellata TaxID=87088 RepID=UPI001F5EDA80